MSPLFKKQSAPFFRPPSEANCSVPIPVKFPQANLWLPALVWETTSFTTQTHDLKLNRVSRANLNMTCRPSLADRSNWEMLYLPPVKQPQP